MTHPGRFVVGVSLCLLAALIVPTTAVTAPAEGDGTASDPRPPAPPASRPSARQVFEFLRQPADEELPTFDPVDPDTPDDRARRDAVAWYMVGQMHESRKDFNKALGAYEQAVQSAPAELPAYQSLMSITFAQGKRDEAVNYALQAVEHNDGGLQLARGLAALLVRGGAADEGIDVLKQVTELHRFKEGSHPELLIHRDFGVYHRLSGQTEEAAKHYRIVFEALQDTEGHPLTEEQRGELVGESGETYEEMGEVFLSAKQPDLAVKAFDEAAKFTESRPGLHSFNLATVYRQTSRPEQALAELQKYFDAQLQSKGRAAYQLLKELLAELDRSNELVPQLETLLEADPLNKPLRYFIADQYEQSDELARAEELLKETIGNSNDPRGLVGLTAVYRKQGKAEELLEVLKKAFALVPQPDEPEMLERLTPDVRALVEQFDGVQKAIAEDEAIMDKLLALGRQRGTEDPPKLDFPEAYVLGKLAVAAERSDAALEFYRTAIDMRNDPPPQLFQDIAFYLLEADRYQDAAEILQTAIEHGSPRLQAARAFFEYLQSHAWEMAGETEKALQAIREAIKGRPDSARFRFQEGWVYYHAHRFEKAIEIFEQTIADFENERDEETREQVRNCRFSLSAIYVQLKDLPKGEQILLEVLQDNRDHPQANNDLGYLWAEQDKNLAEARTMIEKALKAEPENPAYLDSMGWVLYRLGEYEQARKHLEDASGKPGGEDSTIFEHLGDTYDKLGLTDKAAQTWRKALKLEQDKPYKDDELIQRLKQKAPDADEASGND